VRGVGFVRLRALNGHVNRLRLLASTAVAVFALAVAAAAPPVASASCAMRTAASLLAEGDVAFVGRFTERRGDRLVFAVDEALKGPLGPTVEIRPNPGGVTSVTLNPTPGESIGLVSRTAADGAQEANDCTRTAPENLRAAAAAPETDCSAPRVAGLKVLRSRRGSLIARLRVRLAGARGRLDRVRIAWGDGSSRVYRLDPAKAASALTVKHRYRRAGLRRIKARANAAPVLPCAPFGQPPRQTSEDRRLSVRLRRG